MTEETQIPTLQAHVNYLELAGTKFRFEARLFGLTDFLQAEQLLFENPAVPEDTEEIQPEDGYIQSEAPVEPIPLERAVIFRNKRNKRTFILRFPFEGDWTEETFSGELDLNHLTPTGRPLPMGYFDAFFGIVQGKSILHEAPFGDTRSLIPVIYRVETKHSNVLLKLEYELVVQYSEYSNTLSFHSLKQGETKRFIRLIEKFNKSKKNWRKRAFKFRRFTFKSIYNVAKWTQPIQDNKVVFASDSRSDVSGNFAYILNEIERRDLNLDVKTFFKPNLQSRRDWRDKFTLPYHLATAKTILVDDFYPMIYPLSIRKGSDLVQVWHAVGAFKTFGYSRLGKPGGPSANSLSHRNYTKAIVSSHNVARHYAEGFGLREDQVIATGIPRTDMFFDQTYISDAKERIYEEYPVFKTKKVIMFAPTFRGNGAKSAHYDFSQLDLDALYEAFHEDYVFVLKMHPFVRRRMEIPEVYADFFLDLTDHREINELLFVSDILITDYSSTCFEFSLLDRPMLFFAYDLEDYISKRDFYYDFEEFVPGPIVRTSEELIERIKNEDFEMQNVKAFAEYFFEHQDGKSSQRFVDQIILGENE
ncbi:CDP-glycerol glycerophosphotransferase family protein [Exiguobacterium artemiae]|uniref:CDP-glycerol glycerophosphotransferase family protein n=1 Tax=Exiguobacterium artemiae TaxID=340145 RepID=UPI000A7F33A7|nr:CDP-glycerol glycerophosphotransferase family protein [Exiguobacterium sibiricum]